MKKSTATLILVYIILGILFFVLGITDSLSSNVMRYMFQIFLYITLGEMWNLLSGFAGMTSLGQQAYMGLAGYSVAMVTTVYKLHFSLGIVVGVGVSMVVAAVLAFLLLRMQGMYFSITTWVVAEALGTFFFSWKYVGRGAGMNVAISPYPLIGDLYMMALVLCLVSLAVVFVLLKSKLGLGLTAMRDNLDAAASLGVNIGKLRFFVYMVAAVFTALAGCLFTINKGTIYPDSGFSISWTISMVFIVIIGGSGTITGPIVGTVIYVLLQEYLAQFQGLSNIILGFIAIIVILFMPEGVVGFVKKQINGLTKKERTAA